MHWHAASAQCHPCCWRPALDHRQDMLGCLEGGSSQNGSNQKSTGAGLWRRPTTSSEGVHLLQHPSAPDEQRIRLQAQVEAGQALLPRLQHPACPQMHLRLHSAKHGHAKQPQNQAIEQSSLPVVTARSSDHYSTSTHSIAQLGGHLGITQFVNHIPPLLQRLGGWDDRSARLDKAVQHGHTYRTGHARERKSVEGHSRGQALGEGGRMGPNRGVQTMHLLPACLTRPTASLRPCTSRKSRMTSSSQGTWHAACTCTRTIPCSAKLTAQRGCNSQTYHYPTASVRDSQEMIV